MRVALPDGTRIYFEAIGSKLVPDGPRMRERPTMLLLHGGPGFDHSTMTHFLAPLADVAQLVTYDHRGQTSARRSRSRSRSFSASRSAASSRSASGHGTPNFRRS